MSGFADTEADFGKAHGYLLKQLAKSGKRATYFALNIDKLVQAKSGE
jgi:hypothetical protein